jgi:ATP-dependent DNA helicase RecG
LALENLRQAHGSVPQNPLLVEPLFLARYIEGMGTGTQDMIRRCRDAGLKEPEFAVRDGFVATIFRPQSRPLIRHSQPQSQQESRPQSQPESQPESQRESRPESQPESIEMRILAYLAAKELSKAELAEKLGNKEISGHLNSVLRTLASDGHAEWTIPGKPTSRLQKYRITADGLLRLAMLRGARDGQ